MAIDLEGHILQANTACTTALGMKAGGLADQSLFELTADPPGHLRTCIKQWSGSSSFTPAVIRLRRGTADPLVLLGEGARYSGSGPHSILLLRLRQRNEANRRFVDLTKQVVALEAEIVRRLRAEQELVEANKRKDEFLAILAHELRNPLAPIMNSMQLLKLTDDPASVMDKCHAIIERQVQQLTRLVDDLLDVSRWTRGIVELRRETVSLSDILRDAIATSEPIISSRSHTLVLKLPPHDVQIYGDPARLVQVLSNLLNNAAKYMSAAGKVGVSVDTAADEVSIRITDTGVGIPDSMLERIFELFMRVDSSLERSNEGLGIGLTLTKQIVEAHGGTIKALSAGKNLGSEFVVRLPMYRTKAMEQPDASTDAITDTKGLRVLVVDDNRDAADSLGAMLAALGNEVRVRYSGVEALASVTAFRPEIVFLDIGMPGMNGYDVCRQLRGASDCRIRIVALTGYGQLSDRFRSQAAGFDEHLVKPISIASLRQALSPQRMQRRESQGYPVSFVK
jgi:signal transduction histidine kinase/ActR/RegA family two-component response regulator